MVAEAGTRVWWVGSFLTIAILMSNCCGVVSRGRCSVSEQVQQQGKRSESERVRLLESKRMRIKETLANEGHVIVITVSFVKTGVGRSSFCTACLSAARHASRTSTGGNQSDRRRSISFGVRSP